MHLEHYKHNFNTLKKNRKNRIFCHVNYCVTRHMRCAGSLGEKKNVVLAHVFKKVRSSTPKRAVHAEAGCAHADSSPEPTAVNNGDIAVS